MAQVIFIFLFYFFIHFNQLFIFQKYRYLLTSPVFALLIELNVNKKNLNATLEWLEKWKNLSLDFKKCISLIVFLLENGKKELALSLIDKKIIKLSNYIFLHVANLFLK